MSIKDELWFIFSYSYRKTKTISADFSWSLKTEKYWKMLPFALFLFLFLFFFLNPLWFQLLTADNIILINVFPSTLGLLRLEEEFQKSIPHKSNNFHLPKKLLDGVCFSDFLIYFFKRCSSLSLLDFSQKNIRNYPSHFAL